MSLARVLCPELKTVLPAYRASPSPATLELGALSVGEASRPFGAEAAVLCRWTSRLDQRCNPSSSGIHRCR